MNDNSSQLAIPSPSWDYDDDDFEDDHIAEPESSPGDWQEWEQESDYPSSSIMGRFSISLGEGIVTVDVNGESFIDDGFFRFQELVSVMEGLVPPDSENVNDSWVQETILDNLTTRKYQRAADDDNREPGICAICQGEFENEEMMATLQCGHEYHADCITKWLMRKNACPFCNQEGFKP